jgi:hypothetical protein
VLALVTSDGSDLFINFFSSDYSGTHLCVGTVQVFKLYFYAYHDIFLENEPFYRRALVGVKF